MRPTLARTALRQRTSVLPLLLCASVPPVPQPERVVDKLIPKLSATAGLDLGSTVEQRIRLAWQDAWEEQAKDIDELEAADLSSRRRLDLQQLLTDSENVTLSDERAGTTGEQALRADLTRARAVTRDLMRFWRFSTTQTDEFLSVPEGPAADQLLAELDPSKIVTEEEARRQRRRLLLRHQAAGVVEYRIFGEVLARDEVLLDALPGVEQQSFQEAWLQLGGLSNLTGWADELEAEIMEESRAEAMEMQEELERILGDLPEPIAQPIAQSLGVESQLRKRIMELRPDTPNASLYELDADELESKVLELEVQAGEAFWQSWWVPDRVGRFCEAVYYASGALEEGARDASTSCGPWMSLVGSTIRRSGGSLRLGEDELILTDRTVAFPLLLLLVCVGRQGHIEAAAVYAMARAVGTLNLEAIAAHEGFDVSTASDARVVEAEASNTFLPIFDELYKLLKKELEPYVLPLVAVSSFLAFGVPLLLVGLAWSLTTALFIALFDLLGFTGGPPVDPLDFVA